MVSPEALHYIRTKLTVGESKESIIQSLRTNGWQEHDITEAFAEVDRTQDIAKPKLPGPFALLQEALQIYKARFLVLWGVMILSVVMTLPVSAIAVIAIIAGFTIGMIFNNIWVLLFGLLPISLLVAFLANVVYEWGQVALLATIHNSAERVGVIESYKRARGKILRSFVLTLLFGFTVTTGLFLFVIPGIIFLVWYLFFAFIIVAENEKGLRSLIKSREYVRNMWWGVFGRLLFLGVPFLIAYGALSVLGNMTEGASDIVLSLFYLLFAILFLLASPIILVYTYLIYAHLRRLKGEIIVQSKTRHRVFFLGMPLFLVIFFSFISFGSMFLSPQGSLLFINLLNWDKPPKVNQISIGNPQNGKYFVGFVRDNRDDVSLYIYKGNLPVPADPAPMAYTQYSPSSIENNKLYQVKSAFDVPRVSGTYYLVAESTQGDIVCRWDKQIYRKTGCGTGIGGVNCLALPTYKPTGKSCENDGPKLITIIPENTPKSFVPKPTAIQSKYTIRILVHRADDINQRFSGKTVRVADSTSRYVCTLVTDQNGETRCPVSSPGEYTVLLEVPLSEYRSVTGNPKKVTVQATDNPQGLNITVQFPLLGNSNTPTPQILQ